MRVKSCCSACFIVADRVLVMDISYSSSVNCAMNGSFIIQAAVGMRNDSSSLNSSLDGLGLPPF